MFVPIRIGFSTRSRSGTSDSRLTSEKSWTRLSILAREAMSAATAS
ncbi:MAG: hypothetical protein NTU60_07960 [Candidatus Aminicenantes bacterium]|nr:hypothetical protein [Candidatus Aminicenantes bacterium]